MPSGTIPTAYGEGVTSGGFPIHADGTRLAAGGHIGVRLNEPIIVPEGTLFMPTNAGNTLTIYIGDLGGSFLPDLWALFPADGDIGYSLVPTTPLTDLYRARRELAAIAHEFDTGFHFDAGPRRRERRIESRPVTLTPEDTARNGNVSQWVREEGGRLWRRLNEHHAELLAAGALTAATDIFAPFAAEWEAIKRELHDFYQGKPGGFLRRVWKRHLVAATKTRLLSGERFHFNTLTDPWTFINIPGRLVGEWEAAFDLENFEHAGDFFFDDDSGYGFHDAAYVSIPAATQYPAQTGTYAEAKDALGQFWLTNYRDLQVTDAIREASDADAAARKLKAYRRYAEMQVIAIGHDANFADAESHAKLLAGKVTAAEFLALNPNPIIDRWGPDDAESAWRRGYFVFDAETGTLARDFRAHDVDDPTTVSEAADVSTGDDRLTNVVVVPADRIDRTLTAAQDARDDPWLDEAATIAELAGYFPAVP